MSAVEAGERVVLTVHGRAVADIVPRVERSAVRPAEVVSGELAELAASWRRSSLPSRPDAYDVGLTTDDMLP